jgi:putative spermidine/putrescine transport system substrate-binding protein
MSRDAGDQTGGQDVVTLERLFRGQQLLSRRRLLQAGIFAGTSAFLAACSGAASPSASAGGGSAQPPASIAGSPSFVASGAPGFSPPNISGQEVAVVDYGGKAHDDYMKTVDVQFKKETGATVIRSGDMDAAKMYQMVDNHAVEWDVCLLAPEETPITDRYLEPIDYRVVDVSGIPPIGVRQYGVATDFYSVVMVWRTDKYKGSNHPNSWADFWDVTKFPGRRTLPRRTIDIVELALMADGVPIDKMYPIDVNRALSSIKRIQPNVAKFWSGGNEPMQLLLANEVDMAGVWFTRVVDPLQQGAPIDFSWNQHLMRMDILGIPKGSQHVDAANRFISVINRPDMQAAMSNIDPIGPANVNAIPLIQQDRLRFMPTSPDNLKVGLLSNPDFWIQNFKPIDDQVRSILGA